MYKSGFVSIIGKPNAGKSTLLNTLIGEKISIVSKKPQTTRKNQKGIFSSEKGQIVFVDTPGINAPKTKLDEFMGESIKDSFDGVDLLVVVIDSVNCENEDFKKIVDLLKNNKTKKILVFNKIDISDIENKPEIINNNFSKINFDKVLSISALKNKGINELIDAIFELLPEGMPYYDEDDITDMPLKEIVAEKIRQHALYKLDKEIPHGIAVLVKEMKKSKTGVWHIEADIYCEKENHKGIIIGKGGETLKNIGTGARIEIEKFLKEKINLKLFVSVKKNWRDEVIQLANFGYKN